MNTTTVADRAAIEALARELTDAAWRRIEGLPCPMYCADGDDCLAILGEVCRTCGCGTKPATRRALLACLDEVWAGLSNVQRNACEVLMDAGASRKAVVAAGSLLPNTLVVWDERGLPARTPLGRAVLRRAKERQP